MNKTGKIAPHKGRIVDLMLSGKKPICEVTEDDECNIVRLKRLYNAVQEGRLSTIKGLKYQKYKARYFCQKGQELNMARLALLFMQAREGIIPFDEQFHREVGGLLGYSSEDIDYFVSDRSI